MGSLLLRNTGGSDYLADFLNRSRVRGEESSLLSCRSNSNTLDRYLKIFTFTIIRPAFTLLYCFLRSLY